MANQQKKKLGKGLSAIISSSPTPVESMEQAVIRDGERIVELNIEQVIPNPDQPRQHFDEATIAGLAESIKSVGLIEPIIVRKDIEKDDCYIVVAGERRLRATKHIGVEKIRAIIIEADEEKNFTIALIENIQREDLDPIEEAKAYKILVSKFKLKQQEIAARVGKERASVANSMRLLNLPEDIQEAISEGTISTGHAKVLLSVKGERQAELFEETMEKGLSVRALETIIKESKETAGTGETGTPSKSKKKDAHIKKMEEKLRSLLGTKIEIKHSGSRGRIEISYYSLDDFERILEMISK